jgi:hypothetical protein
MSLLRPIVRACAVGALRDRTWAQERVFDSDMTPLAAAIGQVDRTTGKPYAQPYIVVYTDTDDLPTVSGFAQMYNGQDRNLNVVLELGVASAVTDPTGAVTVKTLATDEGMEWACDVVSAQAVAALIGDPQSPYGEIFKKFIHKIRRVTSRRGGQAQSGVRFAARRIVFQCSTIWDFLPGNVLPVKHPVYEFISKATQDGLRLGEKDVAELVTQLLPTNQAPDWRVAQGFLGITKQAALALNLPGSPLPWPERESQPLDYSDTDEWAPPLMDITLADSDGQVIPPPALSYEDYFD